MSDRLRIDVIKIISEKYFRFVIDRITFLYVLGYKIRIRHHSFDMLKKKELSHCFLQSCLTSSTLKKHIILHANNHVPIDEYWIVLAILVFPCLLTFLCVPICVLYYVYEIDFKLHASTSQLYSLCQKYCEIKRRRINMS